MNQFLSGDNINHVIEQLFLALKKQGVDMDIKTEQARIRDYMDKLARRFPNENLTKLNNNALSSLYEYYLKNRPSYNTSSPGAHTKTDFERELANRGYQAQPINNPPQQPDFSRPAAEGFETAMIPSQQQQQQQQQQSNTNPATGQSYFSLDQARGSGGAPPPQTQPLPQQSTPPSLLNSAPTQVPTPPPPSPQQQSSDLFISMDKSDLIGQTESTFTFSWDNHQFEKGRSYAFRIEYLTLPKHYPSLLVQYKSESDLQNVVFSATGKSFGAKLIPSNCSGEYTSYKALGNWIEFKEVPSAFQLNLIVPNSQLDLNSINVQNVRKQNGLIYITTRHPHNLSPDNILTLEFPQNFTCYRVTNLKIIDDYNFHFDSPFTGMFHQGFKLLRTDWTMDLTVVARPTRYYTPPQSQPQPQLQPPPQYQPQSQRA